MWGHNKELRNVCGAIYNGRLGEKELRVSGYTLVADVYKKSLFTRQPFIDHIAVLEYIKLLYTHLHFYACIGHIHVNFMLL